VNSLRPQTVLIVDDEEDICDLLEQWLKPMGHTVLTARNGSAALKLIASCTVQLVVTDILMPEGDGLTVINGVRKTQPNARVLAISGGGRYMDSREYLKIAQGFGADAAIMKPFNREQFLQGMGRALGIKEQREV
jgi:two-component system chemotaxis response regulator CheY